MRFQGEQSTRSWAALLIVFALALASCAAPGGSARHDAGGDAEQSAEEASADAALESTAAQSPEFDTAEWFIAQGEDPNIHGVLIESLKPGRVFASHNAETAFNPASLVKLATTLVALRRLGPDYRFKIHVYAAGEVDKAGTLKGDLYFMGSDPAFGEAGANTLAGELKELGIKRIEGAVKVSPDFCFNLSNSPRTSAERLVKQLKLERSPTIEVTGVPAGKLVFVYESPQLRETLLYMNAHSVNFISERIGNRVGGPRAIEQYLERELKIAPEEVMLSTASGLEYNRMTPRAIVRLLRALVAEAGRFHINIADLMPVASSDAGTLRRRFDGTPLEGALLGKTGTLTSTDGGMSSLAGYIFTESGEPLVFVILDQSREVWKYRDMQEKLLLSALDGRINPMLVGVPRPRTLLNREHARVERRDSPDRILEAAEEPTIAE